VTDTELAWSIATLLAGLFAGRFIAIASLAMPAIKPIDLWSEVCSGCNRRISMAGALPILGYFWKIKGCPGCGTPMPVRQPLIELLSLAIALWALSAVQGPLDLFTAVIGWWLLLIAILDAEHFWLPDRLTIPLTLLGLLSMALIDPLHWTNYAIGAAAGYLCLTALALGYRWLRDREGLGGGDPKLLAAGGALLGWVGLPTVLLWASLAGLTVALSRSVIRGELRMDERIPFGVYLAIGIWLTWLYGPIGGAPFHA
jgi:leader peptidase (prepilin peptidase) / N-methyltransferase